MKRLEAIIRPSKLEELKDAFAQMNISGLTVSQVMGCGKQRGFKEFYRGDEVMLSILPKVKVELVVDDAEYDNTIQKILELTQTGEVGDGKIFVSTIEDAVRIRTGETGIAAIR